MPRKIRKLGAFCSQKMISGYIFESFNRRRASNYNYIAQDGSAEFHSVIINGVERFILVDNGVCVDALESDMKALCILIQESPKTLVSVDAPSNFVKF